VKVILDFGTTPSLCPAVCPATRARGAPTEHRRTGCNGRADRHRPACRPHQCRWSISRTSSLTDRGRAACMCSERLQKVHGKTSWCARRCRATAARVSSRLRRQTVLSLDPSMCVIADESGVDNRWQGIHGRREHRLFRKRRPDVLIRIRSYGDTVNICGRPAAKLGIQSDARFTTASSAASIPLSIACRGLATACDHCDVCSICCGGKAVPEVTVAGHARSAPCAITRLSPLDEHARRLTGLHVNLCAKIERVLRPARLCESPTRQAPGKPPVPFVAR